ncbi:hypothetical protein D3C72_1520790 [compost metagenome]
MKRQRSPNVFGVGFGYGVFLQLEPGSGHLLESVFSLSKFGLPYLITLGFGISAQSEQLTRLCGFLPGVG